MVTATDIAATNGVIHVIDAVLDPEGRGGKTLSTRRLTMVTLIRLVTALTAAELDDETPGGPGPFTVFAPTDQAFGKTAGRKPLSFSFKPANKDTPQQTFSRIT
jgi:transforming growth factor-beta-induced protein